MTTLTQAARHAKEYVRKIRTSKDTVLSLELLNYTQYAANGYCFLFQAITNDAVEDGVVSVVYTDDKWEIDDLSLGGRKFSDGPRPTEPVDLVASAAGADRFQGHPYAITHGFVNDKQISQVRVTYDSGDIVIVPVIAGTFLAVVLPTLRPGARILRCEGLDDNDQVLHISPHTP